MSDTHTAYFEMTYELLVEALHLAYGMPADTEILAIKAETDILKASSRGTLLIRVEHPDLPVVDGLDVPRIKPVIHWSEIGLGSWGWE